MQDFFCFFSFQAEIVGQDSEIIVPATIMTSNPQTTMIIKSVGDSEQNNNNNNKLIKIEDGLLTLVGSSSCSSSSSGFSSGCEDKSLK